MRSLPLTLIASLITIYCAPCLALNAEAEATVMKNIGYGAQGYNIYYGNPRQTEGPGVDPGFVTFAGPSIFEMAYGSKITADGRYKVPAGFDVRSNVGCTMDFTSTVSDESSDYTNSLKTSVSGSFPIEDFPASFTASVDFKHFSESVTTSNLKMVSSVAECSVYHIILDQYVKPNYTDDFMKALASLPASYGDGKAYFDFIDIFGTHFIKDAIMGSRFGFSSYISEEGWKRVSSTGVDVSVAAELTGETKAGGKVSGGVDQKATDEFNKNAQNIRSITLGSKPTDGDAKKWVQQVIDEPMPISYNLGIICDIIEDSTAKNNCAKAINKEEYCAKRLLGRHDVANCDAPPNQQCVWIEDCGPAEECINHMCAVPTKQGQVLPVNRYWNDDTNGDSFHLAPALSGEHDAGDAIFYAAKTQTTDTVAINWYVWSQAAHDDDATFHPSPAWDHERTYKSSLFFAYTSPHEGTVPINRYWNTDNDHSTFHPAPEWPNEHAAGDAIFYAYAKAPQCTAHSTCKAAGATSGDCCPTATGSWLRCCQDTVSMKESMSVKQPLNGTSLTILV